MADIRKTKLFVVLVAIVMLAVACGGDSSDELAELHKELDELNSELAFMTNKVEEIAAAREAWYEVSVGLQEELDQERAEGIEEPFKPKYSSGPCGVFRLAGTELIQLRWIDDHKDDVDPREWVNVENGVWWEKTGVDLGYELEGYDVPRRELFTAYQRDPDEVQAIKVREGRNHYFYVRWEVAGSDAYLGSKVGPLKDVITDMDGLLGASEYMTGALLGVNDDCEWDIVVSTGNHSLETEVRTGPEGSSNRWFVAWWFKDYWYCREDGELPPASPKRYDYETDDFYNDCSEAE